MTEAMLLRGIMDYLDTLPGLYWFRSGSGAMKTESGRYFKTGRPGCPDISVVCPRMAGQYIGLEVKTPTGRQSDAQKKAEAAIKAAGGQYHIVRSIADVKRIFAA